MMLIGITGSFGSGKTSVAKMFARHGAFVIDADKICHSLMKPPKRAYKKIVKHFGSSILKKDRSIDNRKLAALVFEKKPELMLLNRIVHPEAIKTIEKIIDKKSRKQIIVVDAALLVESGFYRKVDKVVVVKSERQKQIARLLRYNAATKRDVLQRIRMQAPLKRKLALADFIIDNSGSRKQTNLQVKKIWKTLRGGLCL